MDKVKIDQHWCLTEDLSRVVPETDPDARWLHWTPGMEVDRAEAVRLGAVKPEGEPKRKPGRPPKDKSRPPEGNKGSGGVGGKVV